MGDLTDDDLEMACTVSDRFQTMNHRAFVDREALALADRLQRAAVEIRRHRAAQAADAEQVRNVVRAAADMVLQTRGYRGALGTQYEQILYVIAARAAAQLTAPPPGHVCPVSYALGPDDLDLLQELVDHPTRLSGAFGTRQVIRNILAVHRATEPEDGPLPEVVRCGAVGCVSSIRKSYLPSGWVSIDGAWRCPRCKLEVPS